MREQMIAAMSSDLNIRKYTDETTAHFEARVLYSAMASWMKAVALDHPISKTADSEQGVSKKHLTSKCSRIFEEYIVRFPGAKAWFSVRDQQSSAISIIQQRLYKSEDLVDVGFKTNLTLSVRNETPLSSSCSHLRGYILHPQCFYSGVSTIKKKNNSHLQMEYHTTEEWFYSYVKDAWWESGDIDGDVEYFNAYKDTPNFTYGWQTTKPEMVNGYLLARRVINKSSHEYVIITERKGSIHHHRLDPFLQEIREYRRILFALRKIANNPIPIWVKHYHDHVHLKMRFFLPDKEYSLLEAFAWPHSSIDDHLEWDMNSCVWEYLSHVFVCLNTEIKEEHHG